MYTYGINGTLINWIQDFLKDRTQRVRVNGSYSGWGKVTSGIPQGSVLGPLLFLLYINDLPAICESDSRIYLFADDAKIYKHVVCEEDRVKLQNSIDALQAWSDKWLLKLNINKCKMVSVGREVDDSRAYCIGTGNQRKQLVREKQINDLGVTIDEKLSFSQHIQAKINKAYSMIGVLKRNFKNVSVSTFVLLYKSMVRSHLEYCNSVWAPYKKGDIEDLERVQKRATRLILGLRFTPYEERLKICNLPTLKYRRLRGDMIETYKIITGKYDIVSAPQFPLRALEASYGICTRGNDLRINSTRTKYDLRKYSFTNRVVNAWNCLPNYVVKSDTTNQFKNRLDNFWKDQEIIFNYKAENIGTGNRSEVIIKV